MKNLTVAVTLVMGIASTCMAHAQAVVGQAAPAFNAVDFGGKMVSLADHKGKYVVLEWFNPACPFSQKHYNSGNMAASQKHAAAKGAVWLSVHTTGNANMDPKLSKKLETWFKTKNSMPNAILVDDGKIARAYGARTTPHMYLVDPAGKLVYAGAIDSKASVNPADIVGATNYVNQAIDEATAGKTISQPVTQPYGCSVKYGSAG